MGSAREELPAQEERTPVDSEAPLARLHGVRVSGDAPTVPRVRLAWSARVGFGSVRCSAVRLGATASDSGSTLRGFGAVAFGVLARGEVRKEAPEVYLSTEADDTPFCEAYVP